MQYYYNICPIHRQLPEEAAYEHATKVKIPHGL